MRSLPRLLALVYLLLLALAAVPSAQSQDKPELTVRDIMRDPKWMGSSPRNPYWSEDGQWIYFLWNPDGAPGDSLYKASRSDLRPQKVSLKEQKAMPSRFGRYDSKRSRKIYEKNGDIFVLDIASGRIRQLTDTVERESDPRFVGSSGSITFVRDGELFLHQDNGSIRQITDFRPGKEPGDKKPGSDHEKWLVQQQKELFQVLATRKEQSEASKKRREQMNPDRPKTIYLDGREVESRQLSPNERFVTFRLARRPKGAKRAIVPNYVTESGFTEEINTRIKVGDAQSTYELGIYDITGDSVYYVNTETIPGISDRPAFTKKAQDGKQSDDEGDEKKKKATLRGVIPQGPFWSEDGSHAVVIFRAQDNKDRWIMSLDPATGMLKNLDRQHDEAWIAGPGIGWSFSTGAVGWMPDNRRFWFQSEATGYSHLYSVDVVSGDKKQLTRGEYEIFSPSISRNKKHWYFTSSAVHPGERHFYRMGINGGQAVQMTSLEGNNSVVLSPDEKELLIRYSASNQPWELYLARNKPGAEPKRFTYSSSDEFSAYPWRKPELVSFKARDGVMVPARLYRPDNPQKGGPAVIFVHGAGYLQNVHKWWSSYFREYMFHNLLVDDGYTVLDIDYRGSAGYGRDWRTAIYQFMGGKDLTDQVDGAAFLAEAYEIDPKRIGIYGGSYGGFITFMALFTTPDVFAAGAALRPVSDWAHYNHPYTANILNTPVGDSLAYVRSSPIYHAEGLKSPLLICVGMIDTNVHFQDVVRLTQRLIELGKEDWEVAVYPLEGHGFREPSSWTDEYRRIYKLFKRHL